MFGVSIDKIELADVEAFCRTGVREGFILDFKLDFPSRLEKAVAAFANTYGGMILIGVDETPTGQALLPISGVPLTYGLRERIVQICLDNIYPPLIPEVKVVEFKSKPELPNNDRAVVVVRIHESELAAHAVDQRTTVYLRTDNLSAPYRKATVEEVEWFLGKRQKPQEEKARILGLVQRHAQHYLQLWRLRHNLATSEPSARFAFWTVPTFPRLPLAPLEQVLLACVQRGFELNLSRQRFPLGEAHPVSEGVFFDGGFSRSYRYTEAQQQGLIYHEYGFWWDNREERLRDWVLSGSLAELLLAGLRFGTHVYNHLGYWGLVDYKFRLVGVQNRRIGEPDRGMFAEYRTVDDVIEVAVTRSVSEFRADMIEILKPLQKQVYWSFGWNVLPDSVDRDFAGLTLTV